MQSNTNDLIAYIDREIWNFALAQNKDKQESMDLLISTLKKALSSAKQQGILLIS